VPVWWATTSMPSVWLAWPSTRCADVSNRTASVIADTNTIRYRIRRLLLLGHERLSESGWARLQEELAAGDHTDEVAPAHLAKELLREVYLTRSLRRARRSLRTFYSHCRSAQVPALARLAKTVKAWETEILGWHLTGLSNGPTEAINLLITKVKRVGHGFRNFENYRLRLLLHCGVQWHTSPTARIRGRQRGLVA
jgi:transposase